MKFHRNVTEYEIKDWLKEYGKPPSGLGTRDENAENHWREIGDDFSLLGKKSIIVFPGNGTNSAEAANGMCKLIEKTMSPEQKEHWNMYAMYYGYNSCGEVPSVIRAVEFMDNYLVPLIASKDEEGDLHRLDTETAMQNLRNVIIYTHCYGGSIAEKISEQLNEVMLDIGYTDKECDHILKQLVVMQHANIDEDLGKYPSKCTQLIRISQRDMQRRAESYGSMGFSLLNGSLGDDGFSYIKISENERILLTKSITEDFDDHNLGYWISSKGKTPEGQKEDQVFSLLFNEILSSDYSIENMEQVLKNAVEKNPQYKKLCSGCLHSGMQFQEDHKKLHEEARVEYGELVQKSKNKTLTSIDIFDSNPQVCLISDEKKSFLVETFIEEKEWCLATTWIRKIMPVVEQKARVYDNVEFNKSIPSWIEQAINDKQVNFIKEIPARYFIDVDISKADDKLLSVIADNFMKVELPFWGRDSYMDKFAEIYTLAEKMPQTEYTRSIQQKLENMFFNQTDKINRCDLLLISEKAQEFGSTRLSKIIEKQSMQKSAVETVVDEEYCRGKSVAHKATEAKKQNLFKQTTSFFQRLKCR